MPNHILSKFSYTVEMLIQAGKKHISVTSVPIHTNSKTRESRLAKNIPNFIARSMATMVRIYAMYEPFRVLFYVGSILSVIGLFSCNIPELLHDTHRTM